MLALGCAHAPTPGPHVVRAAAPSDTEQYCAWYGDARDGVLYFGTAAFWSAMRAADDDPRADLARPGPQQIGRFDLAREAMLPPLDVSVPDARSGVWDVHAHANGRVYFTTFYEAMGAVDPATGEVTHFPELGLGLNEIAPLPDGNLLVTRYGGDADRPGSLLVLTPEGRALAEHPVPAPPGYRSAPKTPAWHAAAQRYWTTNDLIGSAPGEVATDATVLGADGALVRRIAEPEVQFVAALADGGLARVESAGDALRIELGGQRVPLDDRFVASLDFAQDVKAHLDGDLLVTRWSGRVHRVTRDGAVRSTTLPGLADGGLYYTAVRHGERICATHCGGVEVVCTDAP